jgi:hypothetical protein
MAYNPDIGLTTDMVKKFAKSKPGDFFPSFEQAIRLGQETPESAATAFRNEASVRRWNPKKTETFARMLSGMQPIAINPERYKTFTPIAQKSYIDILGREATPDEIAQQISYASSRRISPSDPGAFEAFMGDVLSTSREGQSKIKTPDDFTAERLYGTMQRDAQGNLIRGRYAFNAEEVGRAANAMLGN